jgi:hypothetical protein
MPASLSTEIGRSKLKIWAKKANGVASACLYKLGPSSMLQAMEYNDMLSGAATRINTAALDLEFAERRGAAPANKLFRQVIQNPFSGFKVMPIKHSAPNQRDSKSEARFDSIILGR